MARDANVMKSRNSIDDNEQPVALRASRGRERELDKSCRERVTHVSAKRCQRQTGPSAVLPPSKQLHRCTQLANDDPSSSQRSASSTNAHDRKPRRGSQLQLTQWRLGRKKGAPTRTPRSSLSLDVLIERIGADECGGGRRGCRAEGPLGTPNRVRVRARAWHPAHP
jgi:hypothetical protein